MFALLYLLSMPQVVGEEQVGLVLIGASVGYPGLEIARGLLYVEVLNVPLLYSL